MKAHIGRVKGSPAALALALAALLAPALARAHPVGLSRSDLEVSGRTIAVRLQGSAREFGLAPPRDLVLTPSPSPEAMASSLGRVALRQDGVACTFTAGGFAWEPPDGFTMDGTFACPREVDRLEVDLAFLDSLPRGHTHVARVSLGAGAPEQHVARAGASAFTVTRREPAWRRAAAFVRLGVEHILTGYDHLAFLLAVLLLAPTLRRVVQLVTSFTVAHSLTLGAAALGAISVPPRIVEPLIAASVVAVAVENLWLLRRGTGPAVRERALGRRWVLTFAFGLVHGLGFAGALGEVHLEGAPFALALVSFNLGVELGQVAVAAILVPLVLRMRGGRLAERVPRLGSAAVAVLGAVWFVERVSVAG